MKGKDLITQLIQQDLKHNQLTVGLRLLGLEDSGLHSLDILSIVAELMEVPENVIDERWGELYVSFLNEAHKYKVSGLGTELKPLAEKCYEMLVACMEIESRTQSFETI